MSLQKLPRSEFLKRRAYWLLWKKASDADPGEHEHPSAPGVTVSEFGDLEEGATIIGE